MMKKIVCSLLSMFAMAAFGAVDANTADQAGLESIKGVGPAMSSRIVEERKKGAFKNWTDMVDRVKGLGEGNAAKLSEVGMTVNGAAYKGAPAKPPADASADKPAKKRAKPADAKTSSPKAPEKH